MADDIVLSAAIGAGATAATDECAGSRHVQLVKLAYSADGVATHTTNDAKGLLVQQTTAADLNVTEASAASIKTAVELLDNAVDGAYLNVNANLAGTDVTAGAGAVAAGTPRVTLASDDPGVTHLATIAGDTTSMDGKLPALGQALAAASVPVILPSATITTLTPPAAITGFALETGGNLAAAATSLGLLDNSVDGAYLNVNVNLAGTDAPSGAGTEAGVLRVTLPTNGTGIVGLAAGVANIGKLTDDQKVDLNKIAGASVAVSTGTAATSLRTVTASDSPDTVSLAIIDDWDESDRAKVNVIAGQVGITAAAGAVAANTPRVTLGSDDPAVTALQVIDNCISGSEAQVDVVAALPAGTNLIGDVGIQPRTSGGATPYSYIADGTDFVSVTDGATTLYGISCTSTDATVVYIKFYDKATAPDPSADAASIKLRFAVPSAATGGGFVWNVPQGMDFPTGLGFALVTGAADTDETAVTANEVMVNLVYKH